ncbi:MAG: hypothetical protein WB471_02300 [Nocardioides sp.]
MRNKFIGLFLVAALSVAMPVPSQADMYAPNSSSRNFASGPGGWTSSTSNDGLCLQSVLCPAVKNTWRRGGTDGNGYIRTQFTSVAETLLGTSVGVWQSPAFTYKGNNGHTPATVKLNLNKRSNLGALLGADIANGTNYRVDLVKPRGRLINVIPTRRLRDNTTFSAVRSASVNPKLLKIGSVYRIRITTTYHSAATVIATGKVDYDNVRLTAAGRSSSGITTNKQLREVTKSFILPGSAKLVRNHVKLLLRCPGMAAPEKCRINVHGLAAGKASEQATTKKWVRLAPGTRRWVKVRVKPKYVEHYRSANKVWIKSAVQVGQERVVVRKHVKLRH